VEEAKMNVDAVQSLVVLCIFGIASWTSFIAVRRNAVQRFPIILAALAVPLVFYVGLIADMFSFWFADVSKNVALGWMVLAIVAYLITSGLVLLWANCAKVGIGPRGFPIEPVKSLASDRVDQV
jgi:hypothetical protein